MNFFAVVVLALVATASATPLLGLGGVVGGVVGTTGGVVGSIGGVVQGAVGTVGGVVGGAVDTVGGVVGTVGGVLGELLTAVAGTLAGDLCGNLLSLDVKGLLATSIGIVVTVVHEVTGLFSSCGDITGSASGGTSGNGSADVVAVVFGDLNAIIAIITNCKGFLDFDVTEIVSGLIKIIVDTLTVSLGEKVIGVVVQLFKQLQDKFLALQQAIANETYQAAVKIIAQITTLYNGLLDLVAQISTTVSDAVQGVSKAAADVLNATVAVLFGVTTVFSIALHAFVIIIQATLQTVVTLTVAIKTVLANLGTLCQILGGVITQFSDFIAEITAALQGAAGTVGDSSVQGAAGVGDFSALFTATITSIAQSFVQLVLTITVALGVITGIAITAVGQLIASLFTTVNIVVEVVASVKIVTAIVGTVVTGLSGLLTSFSGGSCSCGN